MSEEKDNVNEKDSAKKDAKTGGLDLLAKAAETIAGDNKLLSTILKIVLSPIGLIAALCGAGYLWWKNSQYKSKIQDLEKELQASKFTIKELEKELKTKEDRPVKRMNGYEREEEQDELGYVPLRRRSHINRVSASTRNIHLD